MITVGLPGCAAPERSSAVRPSTATGRGGSRVGSALLLAAGGPSARPGSVSTPGGGAGSRRSNRSEHARSPRRALFLTLHLPAGSSKSAPDAGGGMSWFHGARIAVTGASGGIGGPRARGWPRRGLGCSPSTWSRRTTANSSGATSLTRTRSSDRSPRSPTAAGSTGSWPRPASSRTSAAPVHRARGDRAGDPLAARRRGQLLHGCGAARRRRVLAALSAPARVRDDRAPSGGKSITSIVVSHLTRDQRDRSPRCRRTTRGTGELAHSPTRAGESNRAEHAPSPTPGSTVDLHGARPGAHRPA